MFDHSQLDPLWFLMNSHDWYVLRTTMDHVRAWTWCLANFITFVSYFMIPLELRHWRRAIPASRAVEVVSRLFIAFIFLCGLSHLAMIVIMPTAPTWVIVSVYIPMAYVSLWTVVVLRNHRRSIVDVLQAMNGLFPDGR